MKKFLSIALIAIMGLSFTSCGDKNSNDAEAEASAKATNDPISVAMGEFMGKGMAMQQQAQPTPIDKKLFIEGLGAVLDADTTSNYSYLLGMQAAMNVMAQVNQLKATQNITLDLATLKKEISKAFNSEKVATQEEMLQMQNNIQALMNQQTAKNAEKDPKAVENNGTNQFEIKAAVTVPDDRMIRSGYSANAELVLEKAENVIMLQESALEFQGDSTFVYLKKNDKEYTRTPVTTGLSDGVNIEIRNGIKEGDIVRGSKVIKEK